MKTKHRLAGRVHRHVATQCFAQSSVRLSPDGGVTLPGITVSTAVGLGPGGLAPVAGVVR